MYRVLIVDDTEVVRLELKRLKVWEQYGFVIAAEAKNGQDALKKLKDDRFDLVLTDIQMPVMNGLELLEAIKANGYCACTALLSAHNDFTFAKKGMSLGAFDYLLKPIDEGELAGLLVKTSDFLRRKKEESERDSHLIERLEGQLDHAYLNTAVDAIVRKIINHDEDLKTMTEETVNVIHASCASRTDLTPVILNHLCDEIIQSLLLKLEWLEKLRLNIGVEHCPLAMNEMDRQTLWLCDLLTQLSDRIFSYTFGSHNETLNRICSLILNNIDDDLTVKEIAFRMSFNRDYLSRFFKEVTGMTMTHYINRVKMDRAKVLLETGNHKIYEVSELLGYKAVEHFSRLFKQYQGVYPKNILHGSK